jgi:UDP-N-acetylmuramyl-tripeptide synthetase
MIPKIYPVACHTNNIGPGSTFVAVKGHKEDGVQYIIQALRNGATKIVVERIAHIPEDVHAAIMRSHAQLIYVDSARKALAQLSAQACDYPAKKLKICAVTGTKGKTTSVFLLEHIMRMAGYKTALLSTVKNKILETELETNLTTQHPDYLHMFFKVCVQVGVEVVLMEVAAQAVSLHRVYGLEFDGLIFTNFDTEHAEFYATMQEYFDAKCALFAQLKKEAPVFVNADDNWFAKIMERASHALTFSMQQNSSCDYKGQQLSAGLEPMKLLIAAKEYSHHYECPSLFGAYNAYNLLGVISLCLQIGIKSQSIAQALKTFDSVPGRLQRYRLPNGANCFIDYAHNPSSFNAVLSAMRSITPHLIVVFGAGGDRDKTKRPMMGAIAAQLADLVVITSDNPRSENPQIIIDEIFAGIACEDHYKVTCVKDRETAIIKAYALSRADSVIMLLGKGNQEYEIIGNQKLPFSESSIIQSLR